MANFAAPARAGSRWLQRRPISKSLLEDEMLKRSVYSTVIALAVIAFSAINAHAVIDVDAAKKNITATIDAAREAVDSDAERTELSAMIRYSQHLLRGPSGDGVSYRYAMVDMSDKIKPVMMKSESLSAIWEKGDKQVVSVETSIVNGFQIYMPLQRGLFKNNGNMYLGSYKVEYIINGQKKTDSREYNQWVTREGVINIPLPGIAEWARLEMTVGVAPSDVDHVIVHIYGKFPRITDDPVNPFSYAIGKLGESLSRLEESRLPREIIKYHEEALVAISRVPSELLIPKEGAAPDTSLKDEVVPKLRNILRLMEGTRSDQDQAAEELKILIEELK